MDVDKLINKKNRTIIRLSIFGKSKQFKTPTVCAKSTF